MAKFKEIQHYINDFIGMLVVVWSLILLTIHGSGWEFVALVGAGLTAIVGKKIGTLMNSNGMGGGVDNVRPKERN